MAALPPADATRVWDPLLRLLHWSLAATVIVAWLTREGGGALHDAAGYSALAAAGARIAWGFAGTRRARFTGFVRGPRATLAYAVAALAGRAPRHLGHNPLGAWMALALLATAIACSATGWLSVTDRFWGEAWLADLHLLLGHAFVALVPLHLLGVAAASWRQRENLLASMIHGRKQSRPDDCG